MICPCCGAAADTPRCGCGFDFTTDYEAFPTLVPLGPEDGPRRTADLHSLTRSLEALEALLQEQSLPSRVSERFRQLQRAAEAFALEYDEYRRVTEDGLWRITDRSARQVLAAGGSISLGLHNGGSVFCAGESDIRTACTGWRDIAAVAACNHHCIALKKDGTVVTDNPANEDAMKNWTHIRAIAAGNFSFSTGSVFAGLTDRGTVVTFGLSLRAAAEAAKWKGIRDIAVGGSLLFGIREDGTVAVTGENTGVEAWTSIGAMASGGRHILGLRTDGTVLATVLALSSNAHRECEVGDWSKIIAVACGDRHSVGLRSDGRVLACGDNRAGQCDVGGWTDIVAIAAGSEHTLGLRTDGTVVSTGSNQHGQCRVSKWYHIFPSGTK